jgi:hypothetical protein
MIALLCFFLTLLVSPFKSKSRLEAENAGAVGFTLVAAYQWAGRLGALSVPFKYVVE